MKKIPVGIIGVGGYTGLELLKLLLTHPYFEVVFLGNTQGQSKASHLYPSLLNVLEQEVQISEASDIASKCELVFLALPHKSAMEFAQKLLEFQVRVIDLSADYRLSLENYERSYTQHLDPKNLSHAIYGLPEYNEDLIKNATLIANPGCYPTATLLALLPFAPYLAEQSVFVDAKSGVSGAGKTPTPNTHYCTINENLFAYSPLQHRHQIEMEEKLSFFGQRKLNIHFVPHLCPVTRGMLVSIYARLHQEIDPLEVLQTHYAHKPFVRIRTQPVEIKNVSGTHFCDIFAKRSGLDLWINSGIDNLLRGASSQAIYNANLMFNLPHDCGIPKIAYVP
ncbi:N-acetyl-gamma-glutamyl-phosphate reductase [Helicobacter enhydrae]|uniref:N-acetyl-gamma-glutamyl-phosphate reductase n=1 Tax=Helicobacter enhydrae TaxID=222136 RepID=A0A1B1U6M9_9HELI|nr:N-acetyl-gamma-glutamyl-phosphate reductase [Helicobacter enhydrae]ANV98418.1 N-acetyl-gamma-glutamyl-phosphate reductase [Helicobacter enhydrae]